MHEKELIPHLFRTEFSKISSVLSRLFGIEHIEIAEDITSDTFMEALKIWPYAGVPENPPAWLYTVAKNKAKNHIIRQRVFSEKVKPELEADRVNPVEIDLSEQNISDSMLQMLFTLCHPSISTEAQIALSLRILCGFGIDEIATAFLTNKETINKRLSRAKEKLREEKIAIELPSAAELNKRLDAVLATLYLLFSEGYYSENKENEVQEQLCMEAMRLVSLLIENEQTCFPRVQALYALMCFHSSRFPARKQGNGELILYDEQDETLWDAALIARGAYFLKESSVGSKLSKYHLEAGIAYWHTIKADSDEKWESILQLYNRLLQIEYSSIAALNRTFALSKVRGKEEAIKEAEKLKLENSHFYWLLLGELYCEKDQARAKMCFSKALQLARTIRERNHIQKKLNSF